MSKILYTSLFLCFLAQPIFGSSKISSSLDDTLNRHGSANILISIQDGISPVLQTLKLQSFSTRESKLNGVVSALKAHAEESQKSINEFLQFHHIEVAKTFWITNQILIKNANRQIITELSKLSSVSKIQEDGVVHLNSAEIGAISTSKPALAEWGVNRIRAPEAWSLDGGNNGAGAVVGTIDSGVRGSHEALSANFAGNYGWFDPYTDSDSPNDAVGLGTHTMGIIAGQNGIGVAPGSTWMACKGCDTFSCTESALLACGQFMSCPTLADGQEADCAKAPHVVSNSWGGGPSAFFDQVLDVWKIQGIIPVFSSGGSGPECGSVYIVSDEVLSIGSTDQEDRLSDRSARGPGPNGEIKPDICAPGVSVRSASSSSDDAYVILTGSSLSASHTAGVIALLKAEDPNLSYDEVSAYLFNGAYTDLEPTGQDCGGVSDTVFPNNSYGHGRLDAYESLLSLIMQKKRS